MSDSPAREPVWAFRNLELGTSDFNAAMVHFYRAEIQRSNVWRTRLDATTNWAIITAGAAMSFALASADHHHAVILINLVLVALFLFIEARRYRYYELWAYRTRLMETQFFAAMLVPPHAPAPDWAAGLAESLRHPTFPISLWEALGRRFRRNYSWIFFSLAASWVLKNTTQPTPAKTWNDFAERAAIGPLSGEIVVGALGVLLLFLFGMGLLTIPLRQSVGEVFGESQLQRFIRERMASDNED